MKKTSSHDYVMSPKPDYHTKWPAAQCPQMIMKRGIRLWLFKIDLLEKPREIDGGNMHIRKQEETVVCETYSVSKKEIFKP